MFMMAREPEFLVREFVQLINTHDVDGMLQMMTHDHCFTDSLGGVVTGTEALRIAWSSYLRMIPDYTITIDDAITAGDTVVLFGAAQGTYSQDGSLDPVNQWQTTAVWRAIVHDHRLAEWRVYADNEPLRVIMRRTPRPDHKL